MFHDDNKHYATVWMAGVCCDEKAEAEVRRPISFLVVFSLSCFLCILRLYMADKYIRLWSPRSARLGNGSRGMNCGPMKRSNYFCLF